MESTATTKVFEDLAAQDYKYGFVTDVEQDIAPKGLNEDVVRLISGKKQELPIKKLLLGQPLERVVNREAMANPRSLGWFVEFAARRNK